MCGGRTRLGHVVLGLFVVAMVSGGCNRTSGGHGGSGEGPSQGTGVVVPAGPGVDARPERRPVGAESRPSGGAEAQAQRPLRATFDSFVIVPPLAVVDEVLAERAGSGIAAISERLSKSTELEIESGLRRAGRVVSVAESDAAAGEIDAVNREFAAMVRTSLGELTRGSVPPLDRLKLGSAVTRMAERYQAQGVVVAILDARGRSRPRATVTISGSTDHVEGALGRDIETIGTETVDRSVADVTLAVVDGHTGQVLWSNHHVARKVVRDVTTAQAVRRLVERTFRPFLE